MQHFICLCVEIWLFNVIQRFERNKSNFVIFNGKTVYCVTAITERPEVILSLKSSQDIRLIM